MVILVPLDDSGCLPESEIIRRDEPSKKVVEARDHDSRGAPANQETKNRRAMETLVHVEDSGSSSEPDIVRRDDRSKEPHEALDQESRAGHGDCNSTRKRKAISTSIPVPLQQSGGFPEPEVGRDCRNKESHQALDQESRAVHGDCKRKAISASDYAKKARKHSAISTLKKIQLREIGFSASFSREKFKGMKKEISVDLYMRKNREALEEFEPFMRNRSAIVKMIPIQDILVLLSSTGVCCTVSRVTNRIIAFVTKTGELTEDIFYNKKNNSLIVSSSTRSDSYTAKEYMSIPIGSLRTRDHTGSRVFSSQQIKWLLGFDATNGIALMRDSNNHTVFDLETYSLMYKIPETDIVDILCGSQALLVMKEKRKHLLSLGIKQIDSGHDISFIYHPMEGKLELLEIFHEKILIKERSKGLLIIDAKKQDKKEVPIGLFEYHPLYGRNCFLTFQKDSSQLRTLNGSVVKELDSTLWKSRTNEHMICSSSDDDTVIYLAESKASEFGSVNICSLGRGVCRHV
ncbi:uncharacterized protein [Lolium perenne]|uniref:uncharacterized protein n=1 Tax=Lolium perenne TaxID=4522 RepID=UPI003A9A00E9